MYWTAVIGLGQVAWRIGASHGRQPGDCAHVLYGGRGRETPFPEPAEDAGTSCLPPRHAAPRRQDRRHRLQYPGNQQPKMVRAGSMNRCRRTGPPTRTTSRSGSWPGRLGSKGPGKAETDRRWRAIFPREFPVQARTGGSRMKAVPEEEQAEEEDGGIQSVPGRHTPERGGGVVGRRGLMVHVLDLFYISGRAETRRAQLRRRIEALFGVVLLCSSLRDLPI